MSLVQHKLKIVGKNFLHLLNRFLCRPLLAWKSRSERNTNSRSIGALISGPQTSYVFHLLCVCRFFSHTIIVKVPRLVAPFAKLAILPPRDANQSQQCIVHLLDAFHTHCVRIVWCYRLHWHIVQYYVLVSKFGTIDSMNCKHIIPDDLRIVE